MVLCDTCQQPIKNPVPSQKYHAGDCQRLGLLKNRRKTYKKARGLIPTVTRTCVCGATFTCLETSIRSCCQNVTCKNARARRAAAAAYAAGKERPVRDHVAEWQVKKTEITKPRQWVTARCPGCRKEHKARYEYGYSGAAAVPWKNCSRYPSCIVHEQTEILYGFQAGWEGGNGAMV